MTSPPSSAAEFDEAARCDVGHRRTWIVLVDGINQQIETIEAEAKRLHIS